LLHVSSVGRINAAVQIKSFNGGVEKMLRLFGFASMVSMLAFTMSANAQTPSAFDQSVLQNKAQGSAGTPFEAPTRYAAAQRDSAAKDVAVEPTPASPPHTHPRARRAAPPVRGMKVIKPPMGGPMPVIAPPNSGNTPVIPPPK
jgi:hypothetical protein